MTFGRAENLQDWPLALSAPYSNSPQGCLPVQPSGAIFLSLRGCCEHGWPFKVALRPGVPLEALLAWKVLIKVHGEVKNKQPGTVLSGQLPREEGCMGRLRVNRRGEDQKESVL